MLVRRATLTDGPGIFRVHVAAVRELCAGHYSAEQLQAWVGGKTATSYDQALAQRVMFVGVEHNEIVGFGQLNLGEREVEAIYVAPSSSRRGLGSRLLAHLESAARAGSVDALSLSASLNAVLFYQVSGYQIMREGHHRLKSGIEIACVQMTKNL
jgi:putative acetyltransferase